MKTIEIGTAVIFNDGKTYSYGGTTDNGMIRRRFSLRDPSSLTSIQCEPDLVAPVGAIAEPNSKDARITATNDKAGRPGPWVAGPWRIEIASETVNRTDWAKTKRDGVLEAARRLAIADWHDAK